jgi:hypothetical protein
LQLLFSGRRRSQTPRFIDGYEGHVRSFHLNILLWLIFIAGAGLQKYGSFCQADSTQSSTPGTHISEWGTIGHLTEDQLKCLEAFLIEAPENQIAKAKYSVESKEQCSLRFLRARQFDVKKALKLLAECDHRMAEEAALYWASLPPEECTRCDVEALKVWYPHGTGGFDKFNRPILFEHSGGINIAATLHMTTKKHLANYHWWTMEIELDRAFAEAAQKRISKQSESSSCFFSEGKKECPSIEGNSNNTDSSNDVPLNKLKSIRTRVENLLATLTRLLWRDRGGVRDSAIPIPSNDKVPNTGKAGVSNTADGIDVKTMSCSSVNTANNESGDNRDRVQYSDHSGGTVGSSHSSAEQQQQKLSIPIGINDSSSSPPMAAPSGVNISTCVILDLSGLSIASHCSPGMLEHIKSLIAVDNACYPELLGKMFIINCPWVATSVWMIVKGWLSLRTQSKIEILGSGSAMHKKLLEYIDPENLPKVYGGTGPDIDTIFPKKSNFTMDYVSISRGGQLQQTIQVPAGKRLSVDTYVSDGSFDVIVSYEVVVVPKQPISSKEEQGDKVSILHFNSCSTTAFFTWFNKIQLQC